MIRLHFFIRFLGLTGLLLTGAGAIGTVAYVETWSVANLRAAVAGTAGQRAQISSVLLVAGGAIAALAFLLELVVGLKNAAGRRSAVGGNVIVQIALAVILVAGLNVWSFGHF